MDLFYGIHRPEESHAGTSQKTLRAWTLRPQPRFSEASSLIRLSIWSMPTLRETLATMNVCWWCAIHTTRGEVESPFDYDIVTVAPLPRFKVSSISIDLLHRDHDRIDNKGANQVCRALGIGWMAQIKVGSRVADWTSSDETRLEYHVNSHPIQISLTMSQW